MIDFLLYASTYFIATLIIVLVDYIRYFMKPLHMRNDKFYGSYAEWSDYEIIIFGWILISSVPIAIGISYIQDGFIKFKSLFTKNKTGDDV